MVQGEETEGSSAVRRTADLFRIASATVTVIALAAVVVSSIVLLQRFRPDRPTMIGSPSYAPRAWVSLHEIALDVAGVAVLVWFALTVWLSRGRTRWNTVVVQAAAALAVIGTWVAVRSWNLVRWDQIALREVTVGNRSAGLWRPGFSDHVLFVISNGAEHSPHAYVVAVLIHLIGPILALLCVGVLASRRRSRPEETTTTEETDNVNWEPLLPAGHDDRS